MVKTAERGDAEVSVRDRILATASELFYRNGMHAVGVDAIVEKSGVAKTSLYRWFPSKDELIAAFVAEHDRAYWRWWDRVCERHAGSPREQLRALLAAIGKRTASESYRGCPHLNLASEFPDREHPGRKVAHAHKMELRRRLRVLLGDLSVTAPDRLAEQIALLIDGVYVSGQVLTPENRAAFLIDAAETLIAAHPRGAAARG
jgi:AcrR family transcriptional regulator